MQYRKLSYFFAAASVFSLFLTFGCRDYSETAYPVVNNGVLDISDRILKDSDKIKLDGSWDFYFGNFYESEDFKNPNFHAIPMRFLLPGYWNDTISEDKELSSRGYGTYRLLIRLNQNNINSKLALYIPHAFTSYRLFLNGELLSENGKAEKTESESVVYFLPRAASFSSSKPEAEILIHVSNYISLRGGFRQSIELGTEKRIFDYKQMLVARDLFLVGSILFISLYHLCFFLLRRYEDYTLYFSLFAVALLFFKMTTGEYFLVMLFPEWKWEWTMRIFFISIYTANPFFLIFLHKIYPEESVRWFVISVSSLFFILAAAILVFDSGWLEYTLFPGEFFIFVCGIYSIFIFIRAALKGREGAKWFIGGFVIFMATLINDILFERDIIQTEVWAPLGLFVLLFSSSLTLLMRFTRLFETVEFQKLELLKSAELKENLYTASIQSKRMELEMLKKTIQPHFLINSLSAIRAWLLESPGKSAKLLDDFAGEMRIIQNIADKKIIPICDEISLCKFHLSVMEMRMEKKYHFYTRGIQGSEMIPPMIFHTMIENAFTHLDSEKGRLNFFIYKKEASDSDALFRTIDYLFFVKNPCLEGSLSSRRGSGMGLRYIKTRLEESYPGHWSMDEGRSKNGYYINIILKESIHANLDS